MEHKFNFAYLMNNNLNEFRLINNDCEMKEVHTIFRDNFKKSVNVIINKKYKKFYFVDDKHNNGIEYKYLDKGSYTYAYIVRNEGKEYVLKITYQGKVAYDAINTGNDEIDEEYANFVKESGIPLEYQEDENFDQTMYMVWWKRQYKKYKKYVPKVYIYGFVTPEIGFTIVDYITPISKMEIQNNRNDQIIVIKEVLKMIEYFNDEKKVYRDLKSSNIGFNKKNKCKIIDFDEITIVDEESKFFDRELKLYHLINGTYVAPYILTKISEHAQTYKNTKYSKAVDVWENKISYIGGLIEIIYTLHNNDKSRGIMENFDKYTQDILFPQYDKIKHSSLYKHGANYKTKYLEINEEVKKFFVDMINKVNTLNNNSNLTNNNSDILNILIHLTLTINEDDIQIINNNLKHIINGDEKVMKEIIEKCGI